MPSPSDADQPHRYFNDVGVIMLTDPWKRFLTATATAGLLLAGIAVPVGAAVRASAIRYTDMTGADCIGAEEGALRCKGAGGWILDIADEGNIIELSIRKSGSSVSKLSLTGRALGDKAEWRGGHVGAVFRPYAVIVRMRPVEDDMLSSSLLFVIQLNKDTACLQAVVDARANDNANVLARTAADSRAKPCDAHPEIIGRGSAATQALQR